MIDPVQLSSSSKFLLCLFFVFFLPEKTVHAALSEQMQVGIRISPPFVIREPDGSLSGLSIELWRHIAGELDLSYQFKEMSLPELLEAVKSKRIDAAVAAMTVTADREALMDFTHPFHSSGLGIAVPAQQSNLLKNVLDAVFSIAFFQALMGLALVLGIIAFCLWILERKANPSQFGGPPLKGLGAGFWWSAVTMTTVGYGDKAPITFWGRLLAIIWMFSSVITISGFTATIASVFTVQQIHGSIRGPQDLHGHTIGTVKGSTGEKYAQRHALGNRSQNSPEDALRALIQGKTAAVVYDLPILRYITKEYYGDQITVLPQAFERQDYAIALPQESELREKINGALLRYIVSPEWQLQLSRYLGN